ncbi:MAG: hypothetical protein E7381_04720 [Clostridiales bacterium]|nr:hypothetical protein [Clostridiales bacterium]
MTIEERLQNLELEDLVGQTLCYDIYDRDDPKEIEEILKKIRPGGIFLTRMSQEKIKMYTDMANKYTKLPVIVAADVENGPAAIVEDSVFIPHQMAWGACDDADLLKKAGRATAKICRKNGVHWTFSPIIDINYNFRNPESNIRSVSDDPKQVVKMTKAMMEGMQENGYMVTACKHFPGQGMDERNSHFLTTSNPMTQEEWMNTYGWVYKQMIEAGAPSIMVGHGGLECFEKEIDPLFGALPAVLSKSLMTDLLKGILGFDGCLVSDAMSMIGVASRVNDLAEIGVKFLKAGGDVILFPEPTDFDNVLQAVKSGELPMERLKDAVLRMLRLKERVRLFEEQSKINAEIGDVTDMEEIAQEIADKSIKVVRDYNHVIPTKLEKGSKILMLNMLEPHFHKPPTGKELSAMKQAFEERGYIVDEIYTAKHKQVQEIMNNYDMICLNCKMSSQDYNGASMRVNWNNIMVLWRGYVLQHKRFVFTSFGDPYKLFDFPYLKEYVNAFSFTDASQRAVVKVILGEIEAQGKNPVRLEGFFEREV